MPKFMALLSADDVGVGSKEYSKLIGVSCTDGTGAVGLVLSSNGCTLRRPPRLERVYVQATPSAAQRAQAGFVALHLRWRERQGKQARDTRWIGPPAGGSESPVIVHAV